MKRGQVTIFIIIGILLVAVVGILLYVYNENVRTSLGGERESGFDSSEIAPLQEFIDTCIASTVEADVESLISNAGFFQEASYLTFYQDDFVNYLIFDTEESGAPNRANSVSFLQSSVSDNVKTKLIDDCSLDDFDFITSLDIEEIEVTTKIGDLSVISSVVFPITLGKGESEVELNEFSNVVESNFGRLYQVALDIVDLEVSNEFNFADFSVQNNDVGINKDNEYQEVSIYTLYLNEEVLRFAVYRGEE